MMAFVLGSRLIFLPLFFIRVLSSGKALHDSGVFEKIKSHEKNSFPDSFTASVKPISEQA